MSVIALKIDVTRIDKSKIFVGKQKADGSIPKYVDIVLIENRDGTDKWGNDFMVCQSVTKEEREKGIKGAILGNAKYVGGKPKPPEPAKPKPKPTPPVDDDVPPEEDDDVPF